jgi:hypothetical protein
MRSVFLFEIGVGPCAAVADLTNLCATALYENQQQQQQQQQHS